MTNLFTDEIKQLLLDDIKQLLLDEYKKLVDEATAKDGIDGLYPYARWIASQKRKNAREINRANPVNPKQTGE
jgi:hypothetical protein